MEGFEHLKGLVVKDTKETAKRTTQSKTPTGLTLRLYNNGKVYPSQELVKEFSLEYQPNTPETFPGCGLDLVDSLEWGPFKDQPRMLLVSPVNRSKSRVDLFSACRHNEDNSPMSSVLTQGAPSDALLELARSMGFITEEDKWVDLAVLTEYGIKTSDGIAYVPKTISKGLNVGKKDYERRENSTFYPVAVVGKYTKAEGENSVALPEANLQEANQQN